VLKAQGHSLREISRLLNLARNTVRRIVRQPPSAGPAERRVAPPIGAPIYRVAAALAQAGGNAVRAQQLLAEDGIAVTYTSLTRWIRQAELRQPRRRAGEYHLTAGAEMQHDTSPHRVTIAGRAIKAQCASLVLACSRRLFIQYYPRYSRFEAKHFLLEAARFMDGTCPRCIIDNTSVILAAGAGADAVVAPEMAAFARTLGFGFRAHRVGDADRKGRVERPFAYVEHNFLPGRQFHDFADLNHQALAWCQRSLAYRLAQAQMPWDWSLDSFPFAQQPGVDKGQIHALAGLGFLRRTDNVLLIGPPGTGKTGIALALLRQACVNGYRGRFYNAQTLLDELYASLADRSSLQLLRRLSRFQPLVIDELSYLTLKPEQADMFFRLIDQRYGRTSTIITADIDRGSGTRNKHNI
jgi:transposase